MDRAASAASSGMAALIGADLDAAEAVCAARAAMGGRLSVANINAPGQVVVAGGEDDLAWLADHAVEHGIRRAIPLKVAGAFHSPFMAPAAEELAGALAATSFAAARFPVYANATARPMTDPQHQLAEQLATPVRFAETLRRMADDGVEAFVHVGPGDVTAGLVKRTVPDAPVAVVSTIESIPAAVTELSIQ
jgi:[acyl-carrier-protein] S-malonyltransferase